MGFHTPKENLACYLMDGSCPLVCNEEHIYQSQEGLNQDRYPSHREARRGVPLYLVTGKGMGCMGNSF
jgi:hypothetical protein